MPRCIRNKVALVANQKERTGIKAPYAVYVIRSSGSGCPGFRLPSTCISAHLFNVAGRRRLNQSHKRYQSLAFSFIELIR